MKTVFTEEHRNKISKALTGRKIPQETIDKMKIAAKKRNPAQWLTGRKIPNEIKVKMSNSHGGNKSFELINNEEEDRKYTSWLKNKRNRLKQATIKEIGGHTYGEWELLKKQYNYTCPCCGLSEPFTGQKSLYLTEDHIIPLSKGGSDLIENIQPLCLNCNIIKRARIIKY